MEKSVSFDSENSIECRYRLQTTADLSSQSQEWVGRGGGYPTVVIEVPGHLNVSLISPVGAPRIFHEPVVSAALPSVAYDQNAMSQLCWRAIGVVVHA